MQYVDLYDLRQYADFESEEDDGLLETILAAAAELINGHTGRIFKIEEETTRTFRRYAGDSFWPFAGTRLWLDEDLADEASAITGSPTVIYEPENSPPYSRLRLTDGAWANPTLITGYWGYSRTPPVTIIEINLRLAKWLYNLRESKPIDFLTITPFGQVNVPSTLPADVVIMLTPYRRQVIA